MSKEKEQEPTAGYRFRIHPNRFAKSWIHQSVGNRLFIYNALLNQTKDDPKQKITYMGKVKGVPTEKSVSVSSKAGLQKLLVALQEEHEFLGLSHSQSNQAAAHALAAAYDRCFDPEMKNFGVPRQKKKKHGGKFYLPCQNDNISIDPIRNRLTMVPLQTYIKKHFKGEFHKNDRSVFEIEFCPNGYDLPEGYEIRGITIEKDNIGAYWASLSIRFPVDIKMVDQRIEVVNAGAVDLGIAKQATEANGKLHDLDKRYLDYEKERKELQRKLSKKIEAKKEEILRTRKSATIPAKTKKRLKKKRKHDRYADKKKYDRLQALKAADRPVRRHHL